jgi:hypothetical protein
MSSAYAKSIGREAAIKLAESKWWVGMEPKQIAKTGLLITELCLPFDVLHEAVEKALGRPVFTHEFGLNYDGIIQELLGERDAPTLEQIIEMIPEGKRIILTT